MKCFVVVRQNYDEWAQVDPTIFLTREAALAALGPGWVDHGQRGLANPHADPEYAVIVEAETEP